MLKRGLFGLMVVMVASIAGSAMAGPVARPGAASVAMLWNNVGGRALPRTAAPFRLALPAKASFFEFPSYEPPVNRYDWSRWFGWIQRPD